MLMKLRQISTGGVDDSVVWGMSIINGASCGVLACCTMIPQMLGSLTSLLLDRMR